MIAVLAGGSIFGYVKISDRIKYVSTDDASIKSGNYKMSSRVMGRISRITVEEGDRVTGGDVLVYIDDRDLRAQETQARAALVLAQKNLELSRINLERSRSDYNRIAGLYRNGAATKESYDHAVSALSSAQAQYDVGLAQGDSTQAQIGVIEAQLQNCLIETPLGGTVNTISLGEGDIAQPGLTILTVNDLDDIWVIANVKETEIGLIKSGAEVEITVDALRKTPFPGKVGEISSGIVPPAFQIGEFTKTTQRIPVKIFFDQIPRSLNDSGLRLLPGMSVEVKIAR